MEALERARQTRRAITLYAKELPDEQAAQLPSLFEAWDGGGVAYKAGDRVQYNDLLYKCLTEHMSQESWTPDAAVALWAVIDVMHAGTLDDPIPAAANMEYYQGKYYIEAGITYLCTRDTGQPIAQLPSTLVGIYFEVA